MSDYRFQLHLSFNIRCSIPGGQFAISMFRVLTAFDPDFSGQEWTDGKASGGQNGWPWG